MVDHTLKSDVMARRLEVITETGRRRWFSKDDKARIVEETLVPGAVVSEIARRHGLTPQQVFTWRRQARRLPTPMADDPPFVPAVAVGHERKTAQRKAKQDVGAIVTIRVGRGADVAMIAAIVHALKASRRSAHPELSG